MNTRLNQKPAQHGSMLLFSVTVLVALTVLAVIGLKTFEIKEDKTIRACCEEIAYQPIERVINGKKNHLCKMFYISQENTSEILVKSDKAFYKLENIASNCGYSVTDAMSIEGVHFMLERIDG